MPGPTHRDRDLYPFPTRFALNWYVSEQYAGSEAAKELIDPDWQANYLRGRKERTLAHKICLTASEVALLRYSELEGEKTPVVLIPIYQQPQTEQYLNNLARILNIAHYRQNGPLDWLPLPPSHPDYQPFKPVFVLTEKLYQVMRTHPVGEQQALWRSDITNLRRLT